MNHEPGKYDCAHGRAVGFCPHGCDVQRPPKPTAIFGRADAEMLVRHYGIAAWSYEQHSPQMATLTVPSEYVAKVYCDVGLMQERLRWPGQAMVITIKEGSIL